MGTFPRELGIGHVRQGIGRELPVVPLDVNHELPIAFSAVVANHPTDHTGFVRDETAVHGKVPTVILGIHGVRYLSTLYGLTVEGIKTLG